MDASTRLYKRLGEIPEDPNDPESLDDLIVCAFGAFERYYVCWKTKGGEFRQDGYDLPPALKDWLYPTDGTTRDFASLQVVFGRGEEYFASDKKGKLEYKEPELKKPAPIEDDEKLDRQALRRSRTVSFLRPLSETSMRSDGGVSDTNRSKRSSSISSQRASRPPSLSYTNSRTNSDISLLGETIVEGQMRQPGRPSYISQWTALSSGVGDSEKMESPQKSDQRTGTEPVIEPDREPVSTKTISPAPVEPVIEPDREPVSTKTISPAPVESTPSPPSSQPALTPGPTIPQQSPPPQPRPTSENPPCTCNCHATPNPSPPSQKPTYTTTATQTSPPPTPLARKNSSSSYWPSQANYTAIPQEPSYYTDEDYDTPPVFMGRMSTYFSKPGYQLGDSLFSGYQPIDWGSGYEEVEMEGDG